MPRRKKTPHRALIRRVSVEQAAVLDHLLRNVSVPLNHMHPQKGMFGEVQPIAFATTPTGEDVIVRMDRVPGLSEAPFTMALQNAFTEFPVCLDLGLKGWTPESMAPPPVRRPLPVDDDAVALPVSGGATAHVSDDSFASPSLGATTTRRNS